MKTKKLSSPIQLITKIWFDRANGNSYFASRIYQNGECVAAIPFQYGHGSHHEWVAIEWAKENFSNIGKYTAKFRNKEFNVLKNTVEIDGCKKRECEAWGKQ